MIAKNDRASSSYLYAQSLDNSGDAVCWVTGADGECQELNSYDSQRVEMLHRLDHVQNHGRRWKFCSNGLECRVSHEGDCAIKIYPLIRDEAGRLAPVILLFNIHNGMRKSVPRILFDSQVKTGRRFSYDDHAAIFNLERTFRWPLLLIRLHIFFFTKVSKND